MRCCAVGKIGNFFNTNANMNLSKKFGWIFSDKGMTAIVSQVLDMAMAS